MMTLVVFVNITPSTIMTNGNPKKVRTMMTSDPTKSTKRKPAKRNIVLVIDLEGQDSLEMGFEDERAACAFVYHGLFTVESDFIQINNITTGQVLRGPLKITVEKARTLRMFEDFKKPGARDDK